MRGHTHWLAPDDVEADPGCHPCGAAIGSGPHDTGLEAVDCRGCLEAAAEKLEEQARCFALLAEDANIRATFIRGLITERCRAVS